MKKQLLNALVVFATVLLSGLSAKAQGTYTLCSIPGNSTTDSTGTLYDTGGPNGQYQNNENCTLLIAPSCATSITLTFQSFNTEANFDFFQVYDGQTVTAPQLLNANGQTLPGPVTCTSGYMLIVWRSDISIVDNGFVCNWTSVIAPSFAPTASFIVSDYTPPLATGVQFTDQSIGGPTGWLWDFGDGDTSRRQNPVHAYQTPGTYTVTFIAFSCTESDTSTTTVTVQAAPQINVDPDTFNVNAQCGDSVSLFMDVSNIAGGELFWTSEVDVNTGLPVRIVIMKYGTDQFVEYRRTITAIDTFFSNYTLTQTGTTNPGVLSSLLFGTNVLVIPEQEQGDTAVWATLAPVIQNFINNGGSVIWCGAYSSQASCMFNAGVFTGTFDSDAVGSQLTVTDPTHPLVQGVPNPINAPAATYVMNITNSNKVTVVADQGVDAVTFVPYGSGKAIFMAFDFFTLTGPSCRIMSNAIQWGGLNGLPSWITRSQTYDTVNAPDTSHVLVTFQTTGLPAGT
ncbi:MAG: PKD domain-containing protein, partial [Bacteroidota bacterium]